MYYFMSRILIVVFFLFFISVIRNSWRHFCGAFGRRGSLAMARSGGPVDGQAGRGCRPVLTATGPGCGAHRGRVEPPLWCERIYVQLRVRYWGVGQHRFSCLFVTFGRLRVVVPYLPLGLSYPRTETGVCVAPLLYRWVLLWHSWANCATNLPTARSNNLLVGCFSPSSMNRNYRPANSLILNNVTFIRTGYGTTHQSSK